MAKGRAVLSAGGRCLIAHSPITDEYGHDDCVEHIEMGRTVIQVPITLRPLFAAERQPVGGSRMQIGT